MTTQPVPARTHIWDGTRTLPDWLTEHHHWDDGRLTIHTIDGTSHPRPGWMLTGWSDGTIAVASPRIGERIYGTDGLAGRLARAEAQLAKARTLHGETCPLAQGQVGAGFTCSMCDTLNTPKDRP